MRKPAAVIAAEIDVLAAMAHGQDPAKSGFPMLREEVAALTDALLQAQAEAEGLHAELAQAERQFTRLEERETSRTAALVNVPLDSEAALNPNGCYVYFLWDHQGSLLYIGKSTNVFARIGQHMRSPDRQHRIHQVTLLQCPDEVSLARTESRMIALYKPPLNVAGVA